MEALISKALFLVATEYPAGMEYHDLFNSLFWSFLLVPNFFSEQNFLSGLLATMPGT